MNDLEEMLSEVMLILNSEIKNTIDYHFEFGFNNINSSRVHGCIKVSFSIDAVLNTDPSKRVSMLKEEALIDTAIDDSLLVINSLSILKDNLLRRLLVNSFRLLLLGIDSPISINPNAKHNTERISNTKTELKLLEDKQDDKSLRNRDQL